MQSKPTQNRVYRVYLVIHGEIETGPGRFQPGIVSSSGHASREEAEARWNGYVERGIYEEPFERPEYREEAPTLGEIVYG